jgi:hypothetical protein
MFADSHVISPLVVLRVALVEVHIDHPHASLVVVQVELSVYFLGLLCIRYRSCGHTIQHYFHNTTDSHIAVPQSNSMLNYGCESI